MGGSVLRKLVVVLPLCLAAAALLPGRAGATDPCGRPVRATNWIDFGSTALTDVLARKGTILAVATGDYPAQIRQRGALTIYWDMYLNKLRVGKPNEPFDMATALARANRLFEYAAQQSSCSTPWIAENELAGAGLETPWSATNQQYRDNVLAYLKTLASRGARPFLLVNSTPYTAGDAAAWWQQVASVADIVRETYFNAKKLYAQGPVLAGRTVRQALRSAVDRFRAIGIPSSRLGVMLGFQTGSASVGRAGLQPTQAWLETVKWQALAARQVAAETRIASIWSWGWGTWTKPEQDPDKAAAACVWLWTRASSLCNGPAAAGAGWDASLTEGQLTLPKGVRCVYGDDRITNSAVSRLQALTGDRQIALSALFARAVETKLVPVAKPDVLAAERALVAANFGGSRQSYRAALARARVSPAMALGIVEDEVRRDQISRNLKVRRPTSAEVETFYESYPDLLVRKVTADPAPTWLGGKLRGYVLESNAPSSVFDLATKKERVLDTLEGSFDVHALEDAQPLGTMPLSVVAPAIRAALTSFEQGALFERWTTRQQTAALAATTCRADELPVPAPVELETFVSFLASNG
jgi:hypothetical protein